MNVQPRTQLPPTELTPLCRLLHLAGKIQLAVFPTRGAALGFEYDWNGVIFGPDLVWRTDHWETVRSENRDPDFRNTKKVSDEEFHRLVLNVYKVLLTRGMIGTLLISVDPETQQLLNSLVPDVD